MGRVLSLQVKHAEGTANMRWKMVGAARMPSVTAMKNPVPFLRQVALIEGVSFLVLLGIAMPLKYFAGMPDAVKIVGWAHGLLFVLFCWALMQTMLTTRWPLTRAAVVFIAALLPFGPFLLDRQMMSWQKDEQAAE